MKRLLLSLAVAAIFAANTRAQDPVAEFFGTIVTPGDITAEMGRQQAAREAALRAANQSDQAAKGQLASDELSKFRALAAYACGRSSRSSMIYDSGYTFVVQGGAAGGDCAGKNIYLRVHNSIWGPTYSFFVLPSGKIEVEPVEMGPSVNLAAPPTREINVQLQNVDVQEKLKSAIAFWSGYVIPAR